VKSLTVGNKDGIRGVKKLTSGEATLMLRRAAGSSTRRLDRRVETYFRKSRGQSNERVRDHLIPFDGGRRPAPARSAARHSRAPTISHLRRLKM
jgi:hypothetical protein